jgi:hypothetical protein
MTSRAAAWTSLSKQHITFLVPQVRRELCRTQTGSISYATKQVLLLQAQDSSASARYFRSSAAAGAAAAATGEEAVTEIVMVRLCAAADSQRW